MESYSFWRIYAWSFLATLYFGDKELAAGGSMISKHEKHANRFGIQCVNTVFWKHPHLGVLAQLQKVYARVISCVLHIWMNACACRNPGHLFVHAYLCTKICWSIIILEHLFIPLDRTSKTVHSPGALNAFRNASKWQWFSYKQPSNKKLYSHKLYLGFFRITMFIKKKRKI